MTEGELQKRIEELTKVYSQDGKYIGVKELCPYDTLRIVEKMKKEIEQYLGGKHYSANYKRFIHGINDDERLVL